MISTEFVQGYLLCMLSILVAHILFECYYYIINIVTNIKKFIERVNESMEIITNILSTISDKILLDNKKPSSCFSLDYYSKLFDTLFPKISEIILPLIFDRYSSYFFRKNSSFQCNDYDSQLNEPISYNKIIEKPKKKSTKRKKNLMNQQLHKYMNENMISTNDNNIDNESNSLCSCNEHYDD